MSSQPPIKRRKALNNDRKEDKSTDVTTKVAPQRGKDAKLKHGAETKVCRRPTQKEQIQELLDEGMSRKDATETVKAIRKAEDLDTSVRRQLDVNTLPPVLPAAAGDDIVEQTGPQASSTAQAAAAAGDDVVGQTRLQDSSTAQAAAADRPQHDEPGTDVSKGMPADSKPDVSRFFRSGADGRGLPPATQIIICPEATSADVTRLPTPAAAKFPDAEEALSSIEDESQEELPLDGVESQEAGASSQASLLSLSSACDQATGTQDLAPSIDQSGRPAIDEPPCTIQDESLAHDGVQAALKEDDASSVRQRALPGIPTSWSDKSPHPVQQPSKSGLVCPGLVCDQGAPTQEQSRLPDGQGSATPRLPESQAPSISQTFNSGSVCPGLVCEPAAATREQRRPPDVDGSVIAQAWNEHCAKTEGAIIQACNEQNGVAEAEALMHRLFGAGTAGAGLRPEPSLEPNGAERLGDAKDHDV